MNPLNPKKLLMTKWTAVKPVAKQKHFLVSRVIQPELPTDPIEQVEIEAVFSKAKQVIAWRDVKMAEPLLVMPSHKLVHRLKEQISCTRRSTNRCP
jgi:hypothetical protein